MSLSIETRLLTRDLAIGSDEALTTVDPPQRSPIVVGVDAGGSSTSALVWAVGEADKSGRRLRIVNAYEDLVDRPERDSWDRQVRSLSRDFTLSGVEYRLGMGAPAEVLLSAASDASLLVVGRRGSGMAAPLSVGSTSTTLSQESPVPVVVVPEHWSQSSTFSAPVVVGSSAFDDVRSDGCIRIGGVLWFALERAARYRVPLVFVTTMQDPADPVPTPPSSPWGPDPTWLRERDLAHRLDAFRDSCTAVEVATRHLPGRLDDALLRIARFAQLVVTSRGPRSPWGTNILSPLTRAVLHRSTAPVAVIPCTSKPYDYGDPFS